MSLERTGSRGRRAPAPDITLQALVDIGDQVIAAWPYWFHGRHQRLDVLLGEYGSARQSRIAWERSADDNDSVAMTPAYDRDSNQVVGVAVVGPAAFRDRYGGPIRPDASGGARR